MNKIVESIGNVTGAAAVAEAWRDFPGVAGKTYMDVAARGLMPRSTRDALAAHLDEFAAGGVEKNGYFDMIERVRGRFARSINAGEDEIAFTKNVTEGLNIVAASLDWRPGDNLVLCPEIEHPANFYPWLNLQRLGVEMRMVAARDGLVPVDEMAGRIDSRTRLVTTATVSFSPGFRTDVAALGRACREKGVLFVVDAAQSAGVLATDVDRMAVDALACSTQKGLLGLYGMGFLYVRRERAEKMEPAYLSRFGIDLGDASETALGYEYRLARGARRFDVGNFNFTAGAAAEASLEYLSRFDATAIERHVVGLAGDLRRGLAALRLPVCGGIEGGHLAHIVTVGNVGAGGHDTTGDTRMQALYDHLAANDVRLSIRRGALRFSLHLYNRAEDVARVLELTKNFLNADQKDRRP
jgi:cysteine desulfurase/selenocysteine lyase